VVNYFFLIEEEKLHEKNGASFRLESLAFDTNSSFGESLVIFSKLFLFVYFYVRTKR